MKRIQETSLDYEKIEMLMLTLERICTRVSHCLPNQIFRERGGCRFLLPNQEFGMVSERLKPLNKMRLNCKPLPLPHEIEEACEELVILAEVLNRQPRRGTNASIDDAFLCLFAILLITAKLPDKLKSAVSEEIL